jgi:hypothetical protein
MISALHVLGEKLGYFVRDEYPVRDDTETPPAVDVAWFVDETQKFPVMIFEVESGSSNTAPYNAMKVLGTPRDVFEKPLFFFHLVLGGASDSARIKTLEETYGSLNYRIYQEGKRELTELVIDVLSQHRRVHADADVPELVVALTSDAWRDAVDVSRVLEHCEHLQLRRTLLADYALLGLNGYALVRERFVHLLTAMYRAGGVPERGEVGYPGYFGQSWCYPVHLGILAACTDGDRPHLLALLKEWQDKSSYMSQIGPHFGLSQDYDRFIASVAPTFLAMLVALFRSVDSSASYLLTALDALVPKDARPRRRDIPVFHALWKAHVAVVAGNEAAFTVAIELVREAGIPRDIVLEPPAFINLDEAEDPTLAPSAGERDYPGFAEFGAAARARVALQVADDPLTTALGLLMSGGVPKGWAAEIVWMLHRTV